MVLFFHRPRKRGQTFRLVNWDSKWIRRFLEPQKSEFFFSLSNGTKLCTHHFGHFLSTFLFKKNAPSQLAGVFHGTSNEFPLATSSEKITPPRSFKSTYLQGARASSHRGIWFYWGWYEWSSGHFSGCRVQNHPQNHFVCWNSVEGQYIHAQFFKGIHDTCDRLLLSHPAHVYGSTGAGSTPKDSLQYRILEEVAEHEVLRCTPATPETVGRGSPEWKPLLKKGGKWLTGTGISDDFWGHSWEAPWKSWMKIWWLTLNEPAFLSNTGNRWWLTLKKRFNRWEQSVEMNLLRKC